MFNIKNYLEKFSRSINSAEFDKKQISEIIERHTQIKIDPKEIEIKNYTVFIKSSPAVLNKIFVYKNKILEDFLSPKSSLKIVDIR